MYVMKLNKEAIELIKKFEGCKLNAYKDSVGIPTIGYGNTYYENGVKVKMGDVITIQRAEELLKNTLDKFSANVEKLIKTTVTEKLGHPIASTSIKDDDEVIEYSTDPELIAEKYDHLVDIVIDSGYGDNVASTIVDLTSGEPEILREGKGIL